MREKWSEEAYKKEYLNEFVSEGEIKTTCGECIFFSNGCTTSLIEAKYGNSKTPSCSEFIANGGRE